MHRPRRCPPSAHPPPRTLDACFAQPPAAFPGRRFTLNQLRLIRGYPQWPLPQDAWSNAPFGGTTRSRPVTGNPLAGFGSRAWARADLVTPTAGVPPTDRGVLTSPWVLPSGSAAPASLVGSPNAVCAPCGRPPGLIKKRDLQRDRQRIRGPPTTTPLTSTAPCPTTSLLPHARSGCHVTDA